MITTKVKALVQGRDRRPELAYKLALECRCILTSSIIIMIVSIVMMYILLIIILTMFMIIIMTMTMMMTVKI